MEKRAFYSGTLRETGHYFWLSEHKCVLYDCDILEAIPNFIPAWAKIWDGGLLQNSQTPDIYNGTVIAVPAKGPWIAFAWWDRSIDSRGASNSGFYVSGFEWADRAEAFKFAMEKWPDVVERQKHPLVLVD